MPDHQEMGREPTERERATTFAPHQSPARQGDGDPGIKRPRVGAAEPDPDTETGDAAAGEGDIAGDRGKWSNPTEK